MSNQTVDYSKIFGEKNPIRSGHEYFESVVGLEQIKDFLDIQIARCYQAYTMNEPLDPDYNLNIILDGEHGVGKNKGLEMIIKLYNELGILPNHMTRTTSARYLSEKLEAYIEPKDDLPAVLIVRIGDGTTVLSDITLIQIDLYAPMLVFIGTPTAVSTFLRNNPALLGRIPVANHIKIKPPTLAEMSAVVKQALTKKGYVVDPDAEALIPGAIQALNVSSAFSYYRSALNLSQMLIENQNKRIWENDDPNTNRMLDVDIHDYAHSNDEKSLAELVNELNNSIGLENCKTRVKEILAMKKIIDECEVRGIQKPPIPTLHMIFTGNAGTGKTTTAELISKIYEKVGILPRSNVVYATRVDFVANYLGQTPGKTKELIDRAMGGILFIDEAYGLNQGEHDMYGREAIEVLIKEMEDHRSDLMIILAGYTDDMNRFLTTNQGLSSRFPITNRVEFRDYTDRELMQIYKKMAEKRGLIIKGVKDDELQQMIIDQKSKSADFGNARGVRNLVERAEQNRNVRLMGCANLAALTEEDIRTINRQDILNEAPPAVPTTYEEHIIYLNVPYSEKEDAKNLGARWDPQEKKWFISNTADIKLFDRWLTK